MPKFYVTEGNSIRHDGKTYQEGEEITLENRVAKPKLENKLITKENWAGTKPTKAKQSATNRSKKSQADLKAAQDAKNQAAAETAAAKEGGDGGDGGDGDENPDGGDGGQ